MTGDETGKLFVYDAWNRLVTVKNSGGTVLKTYGYDARNHRVSEAVSGTTTDLYYSAGWQVLEERVGGVTRVSNVWSPVYVDAMVARDRDTDAIQPLGGEHKGRDVSENVLCVCPKCHVLLDYGVIQIETDKLATASSHRVGADYVCYHNTSIYRGKK